MEARVRELPGISERVLIVRKGEEVVGLTQQSLDKLYEAEQRAALFVEGRSREDFAVKLTPLTTATGGRDDESGKCFVLSSFLGRRMSISLDEYRTLVGRKRTELRKAGLDGRVPASGAVFEDAKRSGGKSIDNF